MVELDEATRQALLAREGPPTSSRADVLAGLRARLGGPEGPDDPGDSGDSGDLGGSSSIDGGAVAGSQVAWAAKLVGATLGLASAGLLTLKLGAVAVTSMQSEPARAPTIGEATPLAAAIEAGPAVLDAAPPEPSPSGASSQVDAAPPERAVARPTPSTTESTLAAELALIRAAKQLRDRDPEAALAQLELHERRFPSGSLAPEREVIRVELLCALGRHRAAAQARASFLDQHGESPLRARVLASCSEAGTDLASAGD